MATRMIGGVSRFRMRAALLAVALTVVVFVLAIQAGSIWSANTSSNVQTKPTHFAVSAKPFPRSGVHLPLGCRPKYGCP
jgi:hypothetical protein